MYGWILAQICTLPTDSVSLPVLQSVSHSVGRSIIQFFSLSVCQLVSRFVSHSVSHFVCQSVNQSFGLSVNQSVSQSVYLYVSHLVSQRVSIYCSISQSQQISPLHEIYSLRLCGASRCKTWKSPPQTNQESRSQLFQIRHRSLSSLVEMWTNGELVWDLKKVRTCGRFCGTAETEKKKKRRTNQNKKV